MTSLIACRPIHLLKDGAYTRLPERSCLSLLLSHKILDMQLLLTVSCLFYTLWILSRHTTLSFFKLTQLIHSFIFKAKPPKYI